MNKLHGSYEEPVLPGALFEGRIKVFINLLVGAVAGFCFGAALSGPIAIIGLLVVNFTPLTTDTLGEFITGCWVGMVFLGAVIGTALTER